MSVSEYGIRNMLTTGLLVIAAGVSGCGMGSVPIEAVVSEYSVTVSPESVTVAVGSTVQLTATVVDTDVFELRKHLQHSARNDIKFILSQLKQGEPLRVYSFVF